MNLLEHEYEDNVLRAKVRERRWKWIGGAVQTGGAFVVAVGLAFALRVPWSLAAIAIYVAAHGVVRARKWLADRGVESSSTDREHVEGPALLRHALEMIGIVLACFALRFVPPLGLAALVLACAVVLLVVAIVKLREDVVQREERSPDSTDACEGRTRKWTKRDLG